jgi:hypothetical protein
MRSIRRHRPATVFVVACIGLTIAIGTSYAAVTLPRNGTGSDQPRNHAVISLTSKNVPAGANATNAATATAPSSAQGTNAATAP